MFDEAIVAVDDDEAALDALGRRAEELARFGASVDLLVIGPRDQEGESALHLAPLALRLAPYAPCPVLVVAKPVTVASDDR